MQLRQVHGDLARLGDVAGALRGVQPGAVDVLMLAHHVDDVVDRDLLLCELHVDLQDLFGERGGDPAPHERGVRHQRREGAFDLADVGRDVFGQEGDHLFRDRNVQFVHFRLDDLDLGLVVRRLDLGREAPFETGQQALLDVLQLDGRLVRGQDQLLARKVQMVEDVEEDVLRAGFSGQLLNIVDNQHVDHLIEVDEVVQLPLLVAQVGALELGLELVHRDVEHLQLRMAFADLVADGLHDVRFAQTRITVYI